MSTRLKRPAELVVGDFLASDPGVYVAEKWTDPEGVWIEWSDGDAGYMTRPVRVVHSAPRE